MPTTSPFTLNATLIAELIVFALVVAVVARYLLPPLQAAMTERQQRIDAALAASVAAQALQTKVAAESDRILSEARSEGARILATYQTMATTVETDARQRAAARYSDLSRTKQQ